MLLVILIIGMVLGYLAGKLDAIVRLSRFVKRMPEPDRELIETALRRNS